MKTIVQLREYHDDFTESELYVEGISTPLWVLEDVGRPLGTKLPGITCIPEALYKVTISRSTRFEKDMMHLSNAADGSCSKGGVRFTGVRPHGGNKVENTEGCPLCNYHTDHKGSQWGRASDDIFTIVKRWLEAGEEVNWLIAG